MIALPHPIRLALRANATTSRLCAQRGEAFDPLPLVKFFNPVGAATWLATELYGDGDTLFGLADLGFGCPELGVFSLSEIASVRLPFGLFVERDIAFETSHPLSVWADTARHAGSLIAAEQLLHRTARPSGKALPPRGG